MRSKLLTAALLLVAGGLIYIIFRSHTILYHIVGDGWPWMDNLRSAASAWMLSCGAWADFIVFSLPGGLWSTAYILLIDAIYAASALRVRLWWASAVPLIGAAFEVLQACCPPGSSIGGINIGTYDAADLLCYMVPLLLYLPFRLSTTRET